MAEVVLARDQLLDRPVAVKILFPEYSTDAAFVERFRREAQAAAGLNHPNIVGVYDWGREANTYFIVMEYVDGRSLADLLRAEGTLHPDRAADITTDVAAALGFAHRNGVVHRDVKPGNVLISSAGLVKVTDFGIARAISSNGEEALTQTGSVMGTATYFSPEQAQGKAVDPRSDLYSLGIVMYEMVCGKAPFAADNPVAVAYKHVQEEVPPLHQINPAVPAAYEAITMRLLAKEPHDRYASAEDLRADLRRFREGQEVHAASVVAAGVGATAAMTAVAAAVDPTPPGGTRTMPRYDPYDAQPAGRRTAWFVVGLILAVMVVGGLVFFAYRTLGAGGANAVTVPDVANQSTIAAQRTLEAKGFVVKIRQTPSSAVDQNNVIRTDPAAGSKAKRGSTVIIYSSSGPPGKMPKVIGMTQADALNAARQRRGRQQSHHREDQARRHMPEGHGHRLVAPADQGPHLDHPGHAHGLRGPELAGARRARRRHRRRGPVGAAGRRLQHHAERRVLDQRPQGIRHPNRPRRGHLPRGREDGHDHRVQRGGAHHDAGAGHDAGADDDRTTGHDRPTGDHDAARFLHDRRPLTPPSPPPPAFWVPIGRPWPANRHPKRECGGGGRCVRCSERGTWR